jgi:hypothetical protein
LRTAQHFHVIEIGELTLQKTGVRYLPNAVDIRPNVRYAAHDERAVGDAPPGAVEKHVGHDRGQVLRVLDVLHCQRFFADGRNGQRGVLQVELAAR